ncbi:hypothetical protein ABEG18_13240 [Alsobacter sp. KACC 23698]|uniref:Tyr recombinase domain-containing protein n=1 Tax=Alsobacter sp. KACC 23698 TaxID=3149229 RepID=A0AAU7J8V1_9HYPH
MADRSATPGLVRRKRKAGVALYWSALSLSRNARLFPDPLIRLPADATAAELQDLCETYTARLNLWLADGPAQRWRYDGTVAGLCDTFERHPDSPIHEVKRNTADSYVDSLKVIRATVGARAIRALVPMDVKRWYGQWRAPAKDGGPERVKRAHDAVATFRMVLRFGFALGHKECGALAEQLKMIRFERSGRREGEMTVEHVRAFVAAALRAERLPEHCRLSMAIGVATQFETMLRQKDVIGEWSGPSARDAWLGSYTWENLPGGILRLKTSKAKRLAVFDLTRMELVWPLLQSVPQADRVGAVVKGPAGDPIRERTYRKWFREIAGLAGIPATVWNMDSRAGAITEAMEAGADPAAVSDGATHSSLTMTKRYDRRVAERILTVAEARKARRSAP